MPKKYQWKKNDNPSRVAATYNLKLDELLKANPGGFPASVGQVINLPEPRGFQTPQTRNYTSPSGMISSMPAKDRLSNQWTPVLPSGYQMIQAFSDWWSKQGFGYGPVYTYNAAGVPVTINGKPVGGYEQVPGQKQYDLQGHEITKAKAPATTALPTTSLSKNENISMAGSPYGAQFATDLANIIQAVNTDDARYLQGIQITPELAAFVKQNAGVDLSNYLNADGTLKPEIAAQIGTTVPPANPLAEVDWRGIAKGEPGYGQDRTVKGNVKDLRPGIRSLRRRNKASGVYAQQQFQAAQQPTGFGLVAFRFNVSSG